MRDAEHARRIATAPEAVRNSWEQLEQLVDVGRVAVEPDNVGEGHVRGGQDGLQVVERKLELRGNASRMPRFAVAVPRVLSAANEQPLVSLDELGLVESRLDGPRRGID